MHFRRLLPLAFGLLFVSLSSQLSQAQTGAEPAQSFGARDIFREYHLGPMPNGTGPKWHAAQQTQVLARARAIGINTHSATDAWLKSEGTYARERRAVERTPTSAAVVFRGSTAAALNTLLASPGVHAVRVASPELTLDEPLLIHRDQVDLDLGTTQLRTRLKAPEGFAYMIRVEGAQHVRVSGGRFLQGQWGIVVAKSRFVEITHASMDSLAGGGVLVTASMDCAVWSNQLLRLGGSGVMVQGETTDVVIAHNTIAQGTAASNWNAAIVLTDRNADIATDPGSLLGTAWFAPPDEMAKRTRIPHDDVVAYNDISGNRSSGIYSDGSARMVIVGNRVERNSKEGICLDNGSLANAIAYNLVQGNGSRFLMADLDLQHDAVFSFGRMPDGTATAKLPGISIDNAAYNEVVFNQVNGNYGDGVKMVRTDYFNIVGLNTITDDSMGTSARFHFFGIELGSAHADGPAKDLDFLPSQGNLIFRNDISGNHYAGVFFADGSEGNIVVDNSIFGATNWAMESVKPQPNITLNNLTNEHSRNITPGMDPALPKLDSGIFDPH